MDNLLEHIQVSVNRESIALPLKGGDSTRFVPLKPKGDGEITLRFDESLQLWEIEWIEHVGARSRERSMALEFNSLGNKRIPFPSVAQAWLETRNHLGFTPSVLNTGLLTPAHLLPFGSVNVPPQYIANNGHLRSLTSSTTLSSGDIVFLLVPADLVFSYTKDEEVDFDACPPVIPFIVWPCYSQTELCVRNLEVGLAIDPGRIEPDVSCINQTWKNTILGDEIKKGFGRTMSHDLGLYSFANGVRKSILEFHSKAGPKHTLVLSCPQRSMAGKSTACMHLGQCDGFVVAMVCLAQSFSDRKDSISEVGRAVQRLVDEGDEDGLVSLFRKIISSVTCGQDMKVFSTPEDDDVVTLHSDSKLNLVLVIDEALAIDKEQGTRKIGKYMTMARSAGCRALEATIGDSNSTGTLILLDTSATVGNFASGSHSEHRAHGAVDDGVGDLASLRQTSEGGFNRHRTMYAFESSVDPWTAWTILKRCGKSIDAETAHLLSGPPLFLTVAIDKLEEGGTMEQVMTAVEKIACIKLGVLRSSFSSIPPHKPPLFVRNTVLTVFGGIIGPLSAGLNDDLVCTGPGRLVIPNSALEHGMLRSTAPQRVMVAPPHHTERAFTSAAAKLLHGLGWTMRDGFGGIETTRAKQLAISAWHAFQTLASPMSSLQRLGGGRGSWGEHMSVFLTMYPLLGGQMGLKAWTQKVVELSNLFDQRCRVISRDKTYPDVTLSMCTSVIDSSFLPDLNVKKFVNGELQEPTTEESTARTTALAHCRMFNHLIFYGKNAACADHEIPHAPGSIVTKNVAVETRARERWHKRLKGKFNHEDVNCLFLVAPEHNKLTYFDGIEYADQGESKVHSLMTTNDISFIFLVRTPDFSAVNFAPLLTSWLAKITDLKTRMSWTDLFRSMFIHTLGQHAQAVRMTEALYRKFRADTQKKQLQWNSPLWYTMSLAPVVLVRCGADADLEIDLWDGILIFKELPSL